MPGTYHQLLKQLMGVHAVQDQAYAQISSSLPDIRRIAQDGIGRDNKDRQIIRFLAAFASNRLYIYQLNLSIDDVVDMLEERQQES